MIVHYKHFVTVQEGSTALKIAKEGNYDAEIVKILKRAQRNIEMTGDNVKTLRCYISVVTPPPPPPTHTHTH